MSLCDQHDESLIGFKRGLRHGADDELGFDATFLQLERCMDQRHGILWQIEPGVSIPALTRSYNAANLIFIVMLSDLSSMR